MAKLATFMTGDDTALLDKAESIGLRVGAQVIRYSIVVLLLYFGALKWTSGEAQGIEPWASQSPFFAWLYSLVGAQGTSIFFGVFELVAGIAVAVRPWFPLVSAYGSAFTAVMFLTTISFSFTTPGTIFSSLSAAFLEKISCGWAERSCALARLCRSIAFAAQRCARNALSVTIEVNARLPRLMRREKGRASETYYGPSFSLPVRLIRSNPMARISELDADMRRPILRAT